MTGMMSFSDFRRDTEADIDAAGQNPVRVAAADWIYGSPEAGHGGTERRHLRRHNRLKANIRAVLYCRNKFQTVTIRNISAGGAGIEGCNALLPNDKITIKLLNGRCIDAQVRWWLSGTCGVQFSQQLQQSDALLTGTFRYAGGAATIPV